MGTRGAIGFYKDGKSKVTYNHFDSYPSGAGVDILEEIRCFTLEQMRKSFDNIELIKDENKQPTKEEIKKFSEWSNAGVGGPVNNTEIKSYYQLLRELQGTLKPYLTGEVNLMIDNEDFLKDSLFCEWAYIINLDKGVLEVYEGFQTTPQDNRYKLVKNEVRDYYNCALIKEYPLDNLPTKEQFLKDLEKEDE